MLEKQKVKKTWEYENGVPTNFKVTTVDKEYDFVHPDEHERIVNELEVKILELEKKVILQKNVINKARKLVNDMLHQK